MIENMRKYTGLMAVVIVLLAAGLILTMGVGDPNTGGRGTATKAYGQDIDEAKFREMGVNTLRVIEQSSDPSSPQMKFLNPLVRYANELGGGNYFFQGSLAESELKRFVISRLIVQNEAAALGIYPSREKAIEFIQTELFADSDGKFDAARYNEFLDGIGSSGYQQETFIQLVGEYLVNDKLQLVIAGGVEATAFVADKTVLFENQTINASVVSIDLEKYKSDFAPTDEEIKAFWRENEGRYLSDRQLKISYVYEKPAYDKSPPSKPERTPDTSDEDYAKLDEQYDKDFAEWEIYKKRTDNKLASKYDEFTVAIDGEDNDKFNKVLTDAGLEVKTTEFFDANNVPAELKDVKTKEGTPIAEALLARQFGKTSEYQLQAPIKTSEAGWIYVKFEDEKTSVPKTFEDAKEAAKADLVTKLAKEKLTSQAAEIKTKLVEATKAGKSLEDAAKELDLVVTTVENVKPPVTQNYYSNQSPTPPLHDAIYALAAAAEQKTFTEENWVTEESITLVYLQNRVVEKTEQFQQAKSNAAANASNQLQGAVYRSWISSAIKKADIPESF